MKTGFAQHKVKTEYSDKMSHNTHHSQRSMIQVWHFHWHPNNQLFSVNSPQFKKKKLKILLGMCINMQDPSI